MYFVTKTYDHSLGLSACFRQWRAESHCRFLHGYALKFELVFRAATLDARNWVIDFGALKPVKQFLVDNFDHKLVVAMDDPQIELITQLAGMDIADVLVLPNVGCEAFAEYVFDHVCFWVNSIPEHDIQARVFLHSVTIAEHGGNSATYNGPVFAPLRRSEGVTL